MQYGAEIEGEERRGRITNGGGIILAVNSNVQQTQLEQRLYLILN